LFWRRLPSAPSTAAADGDHTENVAIQSSVDAQRTRDALAGKYIGIENNVRRDLIWGAR